MTQKTKKKIGLALGSGSARGLSHIGVLLELKKLGIEPDVVCGTSIGALVGAFYVMEKLEELESWCLGLNQWDVVKIMDISLIPRGGFMEGERLMGFFQKHLGDALIEDMPKAFAAVATDMLSGQEVWFTEGPVTQAVRASISLPVLLTPVPHEDQLLLDGGLVNPVPVSVCRALGANVVIAVNLNGELLGKNYILPEPEPLPVPVKELTEEPVTSLFERLASSLKERAGSLKSIFPESDSDKPDIFEVLARFIDIMEDRITRSRMAGDPPDIILSPRMGHIGLLEFHNAEAAIDEGRKCVKRSIAGLQDVLGI